MPYDRDLTVKVRAEMRNIHAYEQGRGPEPFPPRSLPEAAAHFLYYHPEMRVDSVAPCPDLHIGDLHIRVVLGYFEGQERRTGKHITPGFIERRLAEARAVIKPFYEL